MLSFTLKLLEKIKKKVPLREEFPKNCLTLKSTFFRPSSFHGPASSVSTLPTPPTILYGNWKPITPSDPHYSKPIYKTGTSFFINIFLKR